MAQWHSVLCAVIKCQCNVICSYSTNKLQSARRPNKGDQLKERNAVSLFKVLQEKNNQACLSERETERESGPFGATNIQVCTANPENT
jgi:hypothetical protein